MPQTYTDLSKEELIHLLEARDRREATRLGLVWEANEIERDRALNSDFVALDVVPELSVGAGPWRNLIIEGDNFDALRYLRMVFAGRIKCILIDPPYNTGNRDFIYNDRFVDKEHLWRHSMWLEFMYQRLVVARDLLEQDGVILIHVGEEEVDRLGCLMDITFPGMKVCKFVWRTRSGANRAKDYFVSSDHEYLLCYAMPGFSFAGTEKDLEGYSNPDGDPRGDWTNYDLTKGQTYRERERSYYPLQNPKNGIWYPCNPVRVWAFSSEKRIKAGQKLQAKSMEQVIAEEKVLWPVDDKTAMYSSLEDLKIGIRRGEAPKNLREGLPDLEFWVDKVIGYGTPRYKKHASELQRHEKPLSTWILPSTDEREHLERMRAEGVEVMTTGYTADGTSLLRDMVGENEFPYPKPLALVQSLIAQVTSNNDIILDFFAGSGTTGHAVLAQNQDAGDRRFILVSNTEATSSEPHKNVCRDLTRQRIKEAIEGYTFTTRKGLKEVEGLGGGFAYCICRRIQFGRLTEISHEQVWTALQMIHCETIQASTDEPILSSGDEDALFYVPRFNSSLVPSLHQAAQRSRAVILYSWQPEAVRQALHGFDHVQCEAVPEALTRRFGMKG